MTTQHNLQLTINKTTMNNCLQNKITSINLRLDLGFKNTQVQKHWHIE